MPKLSPSAFRRTEAAVKRVERMPRGRTGASGRKFQVTDTGSLLVKLEAPLLHDSTNGVTAAVFAGSPGSEADTTDEITVFGWQLDDATKIVSGAFGIATWVNGRWYFTYSDTCPVDE